MSVEFIICFNRNGKLRISKWFEKIKITEQREIIKLILNKLNSNKFDINNFNNLNFDDSILINKKIIFKKYNNLIFLICIKNELNELIYLHSIPIFVEILNIYFENVSELDLIFNFYKLNQILDQFFINGELVLINKELILQNLIK